MGTVPLRAARREAHLEVMRAASRAVLTTPAIAGGGICGRDGGWDGGRREQQWDETAEVDSDGVVEVGGQRIGCPAQEARPQ